jgi:hypothetical protein
VEQAYLDALAAVDALEDRQAQAVASNKFTPDGIKADALHYAASDLAPKLHRSKQVLAAAKAEVTGLRAKLALRPSDKTDAAGQMRRLWKLDRLAKMSDQAL